ncbi:MAG: hypothetical protein CM15mP18_3260 [Methanobacteriota archaeon]|nr:MAG: hypothetical protein CM15mP18_3260 [Euryarchaeota archaeon]
MGLHSFRLPDIGEGVVEGEVVEWFVAVGDAIVEDQPLLSVMTDKATVEIPSPVTGTVAHLSGDVGDILPWAKSAPSSRSRETATAARQHLQKPRPRLRLLQHLSPSQPCPARSFRNARCLGHHNDTTSTDDPEEIVEWTESILAVNERKGAERA